MRLIAVSKGQYDIYAGRPGKFGNPFIIGQDGTREDVIRQHDEYLNKHPELVEEFKQKCQALKIETVRIKCFCVPLPCHIDNYIRRIESIPL